LTLGFNVESVKYRNVEFVLWDIGGQSAIRPLWKHCKLIKFGLVGRIYPFNVTDFQNTQGIIYVIDSADTNRIEESRDELNGILSSEGLVGVPLLVLANKQDLPHAINASEMTKRLGLNTLHGRHWWIQESCAGNGDGLYEGLDWLSRQI